MAKTVIQNNDSVSLMISYSRKDKEFIQTLYEALQKKDIPKENIWIDWESIPISSDWQEEIEIGVQGKDVFLFVLTPNSLSSTECAKEIEIAVANSKRIVVIVREDPEKNTDIHPSIGATNWLFMREIDDFDKAIAELIKTLNTDLSYVRAHTRLLERTIEWEKNKRSPISTLRGKDIEDAEAWLAEGVGKEPTPTPSQIEYIQASRKTARRRQRITTVISVVVAIVLGFLSLFAFSQQKAAEAAEALAYKQERSAKAQTIAALSVQQVDNNPQLALELALYAMQQTEQDGIIVPQAHSALFQALATENVSRIWDNHTGAVQELELCGGSIAMGGNDGLIVVEEYYKAELVNFKYHDGNQVTGLDYSPDCNLIASVDDGGHAYIWEAKSGNLIQEVPTYAGIPLSSVAFNNNGSYIAMGTALDPTSEYNDIIILAEVAPNGYWDGFYANQGGVTDVAFFSYGQLATSGMDGTIAIWEPFDQNKVNELWAGDSRIIDIEIDISDEYIVSASGSNAVYIWSTWDSTVANVLTDFVGDINSVNFTADGHYILTTSSDLRYWDTFTGKLIKVMSGHAGAILDGDIFEFENNRLYSAGSDHKVLEWANSLPIEVFRQYLYQYGNFDSGHISPIDEFEYGYFSATNQSNRIVVYDDLYSEFGSSARTPFPTRAIFDGHNFDAKISSVHAYPPNFRAEEFSYTISADNQGNVYLWDWKNDVILHHFSHPVGANDAIVSPDGQYLAVGLENGETVIWNIDSETTLFTLKAENAENVLALAFDPTSAYLLAGGATLESGGYATLWEMDTASAINEMQQFGPITAVAYSPDGVSVVTFSEDYTGTLWNPFTSDQLARFVGHQGPINDVSFSQDSTRLVTGGADSAMKTWDVATGFELFSFSEFSGEVVSVAITQKNNYMVGLDESGNLRVVTIGLEDLINRATNSYLHNDLTPEECQKYIGISIEDQATNPCHIISFVWPYLGEYSQENFDLTNFGTP